MKLNSSRIFLFFCFIFLNSFFVNAFQDKNITGSITDINNIPLPYASVVVEGTSLGTNTNLDGYFSIYLPEGEYTLVITYLGYQDEKITLNSNSSELHFNIQLKENLGELDEVLVYSQLKRGQAKALNTQQRSNNIVNVVDIEQFSRYPDVSLAETVQRLPGISITRDQGEGEFVQIRGVPEQFNSLTLNGQRMPSVEPDAGRSVGLDLVQSSLIQKVTVTKALTPDMDADAIGGMVNFDLREATKNTQLDIYAGYGFNQQESEYDNFGKDISSFNIVGSKRFAKNKIGALLAASYFNTNRGSIFNSRRFDNLEQNIIYRRRTTDYDVNRERYGFVGNFDFKPNNSNKIVITANYNSYKDDEIRSQARYTWDNTREERRTRNRLEDQKIYLIMGKGEHTINNSKLDYSASYSKGKEDLPDRTEFRYRRNVDVLATLTREEQDNLSANTTFGVSDPLEFNRVDFLPRFTEQSSFMSGLNFEFPITKNEKSKIKTGIRYISLNRDFSEGEFRTNPNDGVEIPSFPEGQFPFQGLTFTDSQFATLGFDLAPADIDLNNDLDGYSASEKVFAAYLMTTTKLTEKLTLIAGLRLENTKTNYNSSSNDLKGEGSYSNILPSVHFTYRPSKQNQFRLAYSTGISRPNYTSLVPFESIGDEEINRGNEDLEAINSNNFDLMFERYTENLGFLSFGIFAKFIENQIITDQIATENGIPVFSPINGAKANLFGFEASISKSLSSLNIPITINSNYTFTESEADFGDDRDNLPLANSPKHIANLSFIYDNQESGLSAVIGGVYRHFIFNKFEDTNEAIDGNENTWLDKTFHLDASVAYSFTDKLTVRLQLNNLTNESNTEVSGRPSDKFSKWTETESYGFSGLLGIEYKL